MKLNQPLNVIVSICTKLRINYQVLIDIKYPTMVRPYNVSFTNCDTDSKYFQDSHVLYQIHDLKFQMQTLWHTRNISV